MIVPVVWILFITVWILGCPRAPNECSKSFKVTFQGTVIDISGAPLQDVDVNLSINGGVGGSIGKTDAKGAYSYIWYRSAHLGNARLTYLKSGYQERSSAEFVVGVNCVDEIAVNDMVLSP